MFCEDVCGHDFGNTIVKGNVGTSYTFIDPSNRNVVDATNVT
jgi:hypothetical protein